MAKTIRSLAASLALIALAAPGWACEIVSGGRPKLRTEDTGTLYGIELAKGQGTYFPDTGLDGGPFDYRRAPIRTIELTLPVTGGALVAVEHTAGGGGQDGKMIALELRMASGSVPVGGADPGFVFFFSDSVHGPLVSAAHGLFRLDGDALRPIAGMGGRIVYHIVPDVGGRSLLATDTGLFWLTADGTMPLSAATGAVRQIFSDADCRLLLHAEAGFYRLDPPDRILRPILTPTLRPARNLPTARLADGLLLASDEGLFRFGSDGLRAVPQEKPSHPRMILPGVNGPLVLNDDGLSFFDGSALVRLASGKAMELVGVEGLADTAGWLLKDGALFRIAAAGATYEIMPVAAPALGKLFGARAPSGIALLSTDAGWLRIEDDRAARISFPRSIRGYEPFGWGGEAFFEANPAIPRNPWIRPDPKHDPGPLRLAGTAAVPIAGLPDEYLRLIDLEAEGGPLFEAASGFYRLSGAGADTTLTPLGPDGPTEEIGRILSYEWGRLVRLSLPPALLAPLLGGTGEFMPLAGTGGGLYRFADRPRVGPGAEPGLSTRVMPLGTAETGRVISVSLLGSDGLFVEAEKGLYVISSGRLQRLSPVMGDGLLHAFGIHEDPSFGLMVVRKAALVPVRQSNGPESATWFSIGRMFDSPAHAAADARLTAAIGLYRVTAAGWQKLAGIETGEVFAVLPGLPGQPLISAESGYYTLDGDRLVPLAPASTGAPLTLTGSLDDARIEAGHEEYRLKGDVLERLPSAPRRWAFDRPPQRPVD